MNEFSGTPQSVGQQGKDVVDNAAGKAQSGVRSTQRAANNALDQASNKIDELKKDGAPLLDQASDQAQKLMQQGREMFNDALQKLRDEASDASDKAVAYTKDEPIKAMLIAAASGAFLMGLITMMGRSRD